MALIAHINGTPNEQQQDFSNGKLALKDEPALAYRRYCIYRDLGFKRTLLDAVDKEREIARLLKEEQDQPATNSTADKKKSGVGAAHKVTNVPGSWKQASTRWHWYERAQAFDAMIMRVATTYLSENMADTFANKYKRVAQLDLLATNLLDHFQKALKSGLTTQDYLSYHKSLSRVLAQINQEMSACTDEEMKASIAAHAKAQQSQVEEAIMSAMKG